MELRYLGRWPSTTPGSGRFDRPSRPRPCGPLAERAGDGGASIAWLLFHLTYHEDLAVSTAVLGGAAAARRRRRHQLGLDGVEPHDGLGEAEQPEVTAASASTRSPPTRRAVARGHGRLAARRPTSRLLDGTADPPPSAWPTWPA